MLTLFRDLWGVWRITCASWWFYRSAAKLGVTTDEYREIMLCYVLDALGALQTKMREF